MKIRINSIEFEVKQVQGPVRAALLADPVIGQGVWRDVWEWDARAQSGKALVQLVQDKAVPMANGISFHVIRQGDAAGARNEGPSKKMAERVLAATGVKTMNDVMGALNRVVMLSQQLLPLDSFAPLNRTTSYKLRMFVDYRVVQLVNAGRNLALYLMIPGQCAFVQQITEVVDEAAHAALLAEKPDLRLIQPGFVVPPRSKANLGLRLLALSQEIGELQAVLLAAGGPDKATEAQQSRGGQLATEWRLLRNIDAQQRQQTPGKPATV